MYRGAWKMIMRVYVHVGACLCVSAQKKLNRSPAGAPYFNTLAPSAGILYYGIAVGCNGNSTKAEVFAHEVISYQFHK